MKRLQIIGLILGAFALVLFACEGDQGPAGPAGPAGPEGPSSVVAFAHINALGTSDSPLGACDPALGQTLPCVFFGSWGGAGVDSIRVTRDSQGDYTVRFFGSFPDFSGGGQADRLEMTILATVTDGQGDLVATVEQTDLNNSGLGRADQINVVVRVWDVDTGVGADTNFSVLVLK